jgi:hypothetical protein
VFAYNQHEVERIVSIVAISSKTEEMQAVMGVLRGKLRASN